MKKNQDGGIMRVHISNIPQVVLGAESLSFDIGHQVRSVPKLSLVDDDIFYESVERPNLLISNSRAVFFHAFTIGLNLYETTGLEDDVVIFNPNNPKESSQWEKKIFYATAEQGFALYKSHDERHSNLSYLRPQTHSRRSDDAEGEVWLEIHVEFRAGPGQTVIGQRRRINKNTGEIEYGQTFVQPIDIALDSYAELGRAIEDVLNPQPDPEKIVRIPVRET
ncbi:MAG: hypothetical protein AAF437_09785 [Pseudomonadota bacterium]